MPDREPEPWESSAAAPFLTLERAHGTVEVWAMGAQRFTVKAPGREQLVTGFGPARQAAIEFANVLEYAAIVSRRCLVCGASLEGQRNDVRCCPAACSRGASRELRRGGRLMGSRCAVPYALGARARVLAQRAPAAASREPWLLRDRSRRTHANVPVRCQRPIGTRSTRSEQLGHRLRSISTPPSVGPTISPPVMRSGETSGTSWLQTGQEYSDIAPNYAR